MGTGGNTGNNVGSIQTDGFQDHSHGYTDPTHFHTITMDQANAGPGSVEPSQNVGSNPSSGTGYTNNSFTGITITGANSGNHTGETRPTNAYVNYIIKT